MARRGNHKRAHHHGGAWKVAYADFVTAMMALFLVLWLTSQDTKIKDAVQRAFTNPYMSLTKASTGIIPSKDNEPTQGGKSLSGKSDSPSVLDMSILRRISEELLKSLPPEEEQQKTVDLELTHEGLRISIFDRARKPVFEPDSVQFTDYGKWVFSTLAWEIARRHSFQIELEGHSESGPPAGRPEYGRWEISADRANAVRRKLLTHGVLAGQIRKVAGFADTVPMPNRLATDEINRRVVVLLKVRQEK